VLVLWVDLAVAALEDFKQTVHKQLLRLQTLVVVAEAADGNLIQQKLIDLVKMVQLESF
jgi:hypothetical protein